MTENDGQQLQSAEMNFLPTVTEGFTLEDHLTYASQ
jgi:hypothetical protein